MKENRFNLKEKLEKNAFLTMFIKKIFEECTSFLPSPIKFDFCTAQSTPY